ncbi:MAG: hypothetical protein WA973_00995 [Mesorhizobium sp.]
MLVAAVLWALSGLWLIVSLLRIVVPRWRRSGTRQSVIALAVCVFSFVAVIWCNQFVYLDYGLASRDGLEQARAERSAARQAEKAAADAKAEAERQAVAKASAEAAAKQATLDAKQAALDAQKRQKQAQERKAAAAAKKAAARAKDCKNTTMAFVMSQEFVRRQLKAPSTAEFPYITNDQVAVSTKPDCMFRVIAWVDAQNGFGAQIRSRYVVDLKLLDDEAGTWQAIDVRID